MPRDSQGTFSNVHNWEQDAANGIGIEADRHQEGDDDQAQGLTDSLDRKGRGGMQAALAMGNFDITQVAEGTNATDGVNIAQVQKGAFAYAATDTGTANTYQITLTPAPTAYTEGLRAVFVPANANTGASTLQVGGLTPAPAIEWQGAALAGGEISASGIVEVEFSAGAWQILNVPAILPIAYGGTGGTTGVPGVAPNYQIFTASGTFTKSTLPTNVEAVIVDVIGGGGAGGGAGITDGTQFSCGSGGGAGGNTRERLLVSALGTTETVTIGTGGAGASAANGTDGGASSFGAFCSAGGGGGGQFFAPNSAFGARAGGNGGLGSNGDINSQGEAGGFCVRAFGDAALGGKGGGTPLGGGSKWLVGLTSSPGENAVTSGTGGNGAANAPSQGSALSGGDGQDGIVIVSW